MKRSNLFIYGAGAISLFFGGIYVSRQFQLKKQGSAPQSQGQLGKKLMVKIPKFTIQNNDLLVKDQEERMKFEEGELEAKIQEYYEFLSRKPFFEEIPAALVKQIEDPKEELDKDLYSEQLVVRNLAFNAYTLFYSPEAVQFWKDIESMRLDFIKPSIKEGQISLSNSQIIEYIDLQTEIIEAEIVRDEKLKQVTQEAGLYHGHLVYSSTIHNQAGSELLNRYNEAIEKREVARTFSEVKDLWDCPRTVKPKIAFDTMLQLLRLFRLASIFTWGRIISQISSGADESSFYNLALAQRRLKVVAGRTQNDLFKCMMLDKEPEIRPGFSSGFDKFTLDQLKDLIDDMDLLQESQSYSPDQISQLNDLLSEMNEEYMAIQKVCVKPQRP